VLGALVGAGPGATQRVDAGKAPPAWIAYAQTVSTAVHGRLESDDPAALRLRAYLQHLPGAASDGAVLKVAFWIDPAGRITRIEHALFAQAQPNDDLQTLIVGQTLPGAPPRGMLLPLRLSIGHAEAGGWRARCRAQAIAPDGQPALPAPGQAVALVLIAPQDARPEIL